MTGKAAPLTAMLLLVAGLCLHAQAKVEQYKRFETSLLYTPGGNGFKDITLKATFIHDDTTVTVSGFYDGNGIYRIRFMPAYTGIWRFTTSSDVPQLNNQKGSFECVRAAPGNHGMVKVAGVFGFGYADGTPYFPFGTTAYAWTHMSDPLQEITLAALKPSGFNKIRMCVFPKFYNLVTEEPMLYPFEVKGVKTDSNGKVSKAWDFEKFNLAFFRHLEKRIDDLAGLGIEADLILFHPYDKGQWGFDTMPEEVNLRYIRYITARLSSFKNVWWSLANEWDYVRSKTIADWDLFAGTVVQNDPYRHLLSIHGATATYYDYWKPAFTHVSIQDEAPVQSLYAAALLRNIYRKPVICDEVGYEGNLKSRWGRYTPQEMLYLIVNGVMAGAYVTHGECYMYGNGKDTIFWAKGGRFRGESWKRIGFLRKMIEACPHSLQMADISRDNQTSTAGEGYYFVTLGKEAGNNWKFSLPVKNADYKRLGAGVKFRVEVIDTWNMTVTACPQTFETKTDEDGYRVSDKSGGTVALPARPYIILRITAMP